MRSGGRRGRRCDEQKILAGRAATRGPTLMCGYADVDGFPSGAIRQKLEGCREDEHGLCVRTHAHKLRAERFEPRTF